jgi:hypothetical protein
VSNPLTPDEIAAVQAQVAEQAASLAPQSEVPQLDVTAGKPAEVNADDLLARIQQLEAAAKAAAPAPPEPPDESLTSSLTSSDAAGVHVLAQRAESRLGQLEEFAAKVAKLLGL